MKYDKQNIEIINEHYFDEIEELDDCIKLYNNGVLKFLIYHNSTVRACDSSIILYAYNNSKIYALYAYDNSEVFAYDDSEVIAYDNSTVYAYNNSKVIARDNSKINAFNNSKVIAYDSSKVITFDNSKIEKENKK